ncbi:uncharacterized protein [Littorina saxatilis]|uniref:uncharacterized protein n=1 Tax=Littorina saxatilis TaxID=31220 RepID=UPI0038B677B2
MIGSHVSSDTSGTVPSPATRTQEGRTTPIGSHVSSDTSGTVPSPATRTQEGRTTPIGSHVSTDASNDAGVVVGIVFVVIVIAVTVVIFMLYRRKRLHLWKTCFRNKTKKNAAVTGTSQNGERAVGRDDRRTVNSVNATPTVLGYENHPFTFSGPQSAVSYSNVIKDADGAGDSAAPQYSNMHGSQSADCSKVPNDSTFADNDPYEIKAENGNLPSAATRNPNPNTHSKGTTRQYQNYPVPACNRDKSQPTSDYSLARAEGSETNGVYDYPEEDPRNPGKGGETALYQYAKDPDVNGERHAYATGVYHILERDSSGSQPFSAYHAPKGGTVGQQHTPTVKVSKGQTGNYNTLDFAGKSSGQKNDGDDSGGVYNHLNAESDDPYNEVDREKRLEVIDDEYSHIK